MGKYEKAYQGTRDICEKIAYEIDNALIHYDGKGTLNPQLRIVDYDSAHFMKRMYLRMENVARTGQIWDSNDWEAVKLAIEIKKELDEIKEAYKKTDFTKIKEIFCGYQDLEKIENAIISQGFKMIDGGSSKKYRMNHIYRIEETDTTIYVKGSRKYEEILRDN